MNSVMALGLKWNGEALFAARSESDVVALLRDAMEKNYGSLKSLQAGLSRGAQFRGEVLRISKDPADPRQVGWTCLYNDNDPQREAMVEAVRPLAELHGVAATFQPLVYRGEGPDDWFGWLTENYYGPSLEGKVVPRYVLILGGPEQVPFSFQSLLQTVASVGRLSFETIDEFRVYVDKVRRLAGADQPVVDREVFLFAPDGGVSDPTHFSREYMVEPLAANLREDATLSVRELVGQDATKARLLAALSGSRPALVYTASHGLGAVDQPIEFQRRYNGALCCQHQGALTQNAIFCADDVPADGAFLEGSVFFQFACYGYGTPAQSDYAHWLDGAPAGNASADFVAALPRRLLAHPRGPIAYVGHLDTAFLHGFTDEKNPYLDKRWHSRMTPYVSAVQRLMGIEPAGLALEEMSQRYAVCNTILTGLYDSMRRNTWSAAQAPRLLDQWIIRGDAQNFMVMGDPAAHLRIPR